MCMHKIVPFFLLIVLSLPLEPQEKPAIPASESSVYLVVFRTPAHVRNSKPGVFHGFAADLSSYLKEQGVPVKADPERGTIETESPMSVESMLNIAKQVGAASLLYVIVDRPVTKWIKVTLQSYDLDGKLQWSEEASDGGSMSGKSGYKKTLERIETKLAKRLGGPGLPVSADRASASKPTGEEAQK
jgi:hypothetical protein